MRYMGLRPMTLILLMLFFLYFLSFLTVADAADFQRLLDARTATCWVEGEALDELVLNARGRLTFVCVDRKMGEFLRSARDEKDPWKKGGPPQWLRFFGQNYARRKGQTLFVANIGASKPWTFDTGLLTVAGRAAEEGDILRGVIADPQKEIPPGQSELPSGYEGVLAFFAPTSLLKAGTEIEIGYGSDVVKWKIPGRNE